MSIKHEKQMTLGKLIEQLESFSLEGKNEYKVYYDFCDFSPNLNFDSYRGYYEDLYMGYGWCCFEHVPEVQKILKHIKQNVLHQTFVGYKGGEFYMDESTALWVSEYGCVSNTFPTNLREFDGRIVIETMHR
ncbi:MAG: hypothetical protein RL621_319 [Bacteroidota bacterium]|jgi:hypothetical protein